jgi:acetyl-CoA C-acetyltransferase
MKDIYIISAKRTPIGRIFGSLKGISAAKLAGAVIKNMAASLSLGEKDFDFAFLGNAVKAGMGENPARQAVYQAGLGFGIPSFTIDMVCGSGLMAVAEGVNYILAGKGDCVIAGGMESCSSAPLLLQRDKNLQKMSNVELEDAVLRDGLICAFADEHMGFVAERTAQRFGVSRAEQDELACKSQEKAASARKSQYAKEETVSISVGIGEEFQTDECIRENTNLKKLSRLSALFGGNGSVTAGNSPPPADAAAAVVLASGDFCKKHAVKPEAKIVSYAVSALPPEDVFLASALALKKALSSSSLKGMEEIDFFEINESFAVQAVLSQKELNISDSRFNVWGGSIAYGHPLGASGARGLVTLVHILKKMQAAHGAASICLGGGCAVSMIIEAVKK